MIDDDDVDLAILAWPSSGGWFGLVLGIIVVGVVLYFACQNDAARCRAHRAARRD